ncbi:PEST proteolytic signal-containing nuclear protein-like [Chrysoperla carnea]|uniref:PEST proteolytic signal-containing nuclear protein-like n=1 Tax=Chrysoperla carnea TaxID=189513 RepID=UPI001D05F3FC|nr:PEST proteolytic signal-containing nuclear protein-like [Chrysoperla carnea]
MSKRHLEEYSKHGSPYSSHKSYDDDPKRSRYYEHSSHSHHHARKYDDTSKRSERYDYESSKSSRKSTSSSSDNDDDERKDTKSEEYKSSNLKIDPKKKFKSGIQIKLGPAKSSTETKPKIQVASVFNQESDEEPEEMPKEARMKMRNIGRDTPTSAGPNSFGKTKQGFCHAKRVFEKSVEKALENLKD